MYFLTLGVIGSSTNLAITDSSNFTKEYTSTYKEVPEAIITEPEEDISVTEISETQNAKQPSVEPQLQLEESIPSQEAVNEKVSKADENFILPDNVGENVEEPINKENNGTMLVLNDNEQLQNLLAKAQRGEVTLIAQPCGDGNYILQESIEIADTSKDVIGQEQQENVKQSGHVVNAGKIIEATKEVLTEEITDECPPPLDIVTDDIIVEQHEVGASETNTNNRKTIRVKKKENVKESGHGANAGKKIETTKGALTEEITDECPRPLDTVTDDNIVEQSEADSSETDVNIRKSVRVKQKENVTESGHDVNAGKIIETSKEVLTEEITDESPRPLDIATDDNIVEQSEVDSGETNTNIRKSVRVKRKDVPEEMIEDLAKRQKKTAEPPLRSRYGFKYSLYTYKQNVPPFFKNISLNIVAKRCI